MSSDTQRQYSSSEGHSDADQSSFRSSLEDISDTDIPERAPNPSPYPQGKFTIIEELYYEEVYCEDGYEADEDLPPRAKQRSKWAVRCRAADRLPVKYERDEDSPGILHSQKKLPYIPEQQMIWYKTKSLEGTVAQITLILRICPMIPSQKKFMTYMEVRTLIILARKWPQLAGEFEQWLWDSLLKS